MKLGEQHPLSVEEHIESFKRLRVNMPHDMNGNLIAVGDTVLVPCKVKSITMDEQYCNMTVKTKAPMPPYETGTTITLNTKQAIKEGS